LWQHELGLSNKMYFFAWGGIRMSSSTKLCLLVTGRKQGVVTCSSKPSDVQFVAAATGGF
jgi:hypothetical protein